MVTWERSRTRGSDGARAQAGRVRSEGLDHPEASSHTPSKGRSRGRWPRTWLTTAPIVSRPARGVPGESPARARRCPGWPGREWPGGLRPATRRRAAGRAGRPDRGLHRSRARRTPFPLADSTVRRIEHSDRATASPPAHAGTPARTGESVRDRKPASPRCRKVILAASNSLGCGSWRSVSSDSSSAM